MAMKYLAGVDVGTTGVRCVIFDLDGKMVAGKYREYGATYPKPGWVEQDSDSLIARTMDACRGAVAESGVARGDIVSVAFSTQRSVTGPVDSSGRPVRPMISWQDARTGEQVKEMLKLIDAGEYHQISGMPMGTTWIVTKALWMRAHEPERYRRTFKFTQNQDLVLRAFGVDDYITDTPCMGFYGCWDVANGRWSRKLLDLFGLSENLFGRPVPAGTKVGEVSAAVAERSGFARGTPLCVGAGDQNCGVVGMGSVKPGMATVTLGTAGLAILSTDQPIRGLESMMITHHAVPGMWEAEGLSNAAAGSYRWFRDVIGTHEKELEARHGRSAYEYLNDLAASAKPGSKGLLYMPYLATAGAPRWNASARSVFVGMSFAHGRGELARAVMEGVALEIRDMMESWMAAGLKIDVLRLGGGAAQSPLWNQIQADVYGRPVQTLQCGESTVLGAAILAGVGAGVFKSIAQGVQAMVHVAGEVDPRNENRQVYNDMYEAYVKTYEGLTQSGAFDKLAGVQAAS